MCVLLCKCVCCCVSVCVSVCVCVWFEVQKATAVVCQVLSGSSAGACTVYVALWICVFMHGSRILINVSEFVCVCVC